MCVCVRLELENSKVLFLRHMNDCNKHTILCKRYIKQVKISALKSAHIRYLLEGPHKVDIN